MPTMREIKAATAVTGTIRPFLSKAQMRCVAVNCLGEDPESFIETLVDLAAVIETMPKTYEQEGKGDAATVHLHYFLGGSDWYITEKDKDGGIDQAFGYTVLNGYDDDAEMGYISIAELVANGVELDFYFKARTLGEIKAERNAPQAVEDTPKDWVIVTKAGEDGQETWGDYATFKEAAANLSEPGEKAEIMRRLDDGTLTTEY